MTTSFSAMHLGASSLESSVISTDGTVSSEHKSFVDPDMRREQTYDELLEVITAAFKGTSTAEPLDTLVLTTPIPIDSKRGFVGLAPAMKGMQDRPLRDDLAKSLSQSCGRDIRVIVWNDANAAGLRSKVKGNAADHDLVIHLRIATGLGGCIMKGNEVLGGRNAMAGEIGHIILQPFGMRCGCGNMGCAETLIGGRSLLQQIQSQDPELRFGHFSEAIRAADDGVQIAISVIDTMGMYLGLLLSSVANVLNPDAITMSGSLFDKSGRLLAKARQVFKRRVCIGLECPVLLDECSKDSHAEAALAIYHRETNEIK